jgi:putative tricarboxylic transport membrane protein
MKLIFTAALFLVSVGYTWLAFGMKFTSDGRPGGGFLPTIIGIILVILTGIELYKVMKESKTNKKPEDGTPYLKDIIYLIILIALMIFFLRIIGGLIAMILFVYGVLFAFNRGKHLQNILTSLIVPITVFLLFEVWLNAGIPKLFFYF